ncbi:MAG: hypothetical protein J5663_04260 [Bacteroidaceae bacterium]|jgi:hypothetical protein|nr:hypothetical protein [Bacteroidaceae bacterium]
MNKIVVNVILALLTVGLAWACFWSIYSDIAFDEQKAVREKAVKERLLQIKDAEELYKKTYGEYVGTLDSLIDFVKNGRAVAKIIKEGELSDDQLEAGLTEREAARQGLIRRDTIWTTAGEMLGIACPDSLKYIPVGRVADGSTEKKVSNFDAKDFVEVKVGEFELRKKASFNVRTNEFDILLEVRARLDYYMDGFSEKRIKNLKSDLKKLSKNKGELMLDNQDDFEGEWYGLRIGDLSDTGNKLAGNWDE